MTRMWKCLISCFMEDVNKRRQIFLSLLNLSEVPRNSIPGKFADNWHFQRFGINCCRHCRWCQSSLIIITAAGVKTLSHSRTTWLIFLLTPCWKVRSPWGRGCDWLVMHFFHPFYCSYGITVRPALLSSNKLDTMDLHLLLIGIQKRRTG